MLRRILAAALVAAMLAPLPAMAARGCAMTEPWISAERCDCCKDAAAPGASCSTAAVLASGCACAIRAESSQPAANAASPAAAPAFDVALIPASMSTPQSHTRQIPTGGAPPGAARAALRPLLCTWIL